VLRAIEGFHADDEGHWVSELSCLHGQHVRHQPPFRDRAWVLTEDGRAAHLGAELDCPLCDRAELPDGLVLARVAGPFDAGSVPAGLRRDHRVAARTWGRLRVASGTLGFTMATRPPVERTVGAGEEQAIPPDLAHAVHVTGPVTFTVEFLVRPVAG